MGIPSDVSASASGNVSVARGSEVRCDHRRRAVCGLADRHAAGATGVQGAARRPSRLPERYYSTHILSPHGTDILARGVSSTRSAATGTAICRHMTFDVGPFALRGAIPDANDGSAILPERTGLDSLLLRAAAEAGVEVREGFTVDDLLVTGDTVLGIRGHGRDKRTVEEHSRMVIGADGANSFVARAVRERRTTCARSQPVATTRISAASGKTISSCTSGTTTRSVARQPTMVSTS